MFVQIGIIHSTSFKIRFDVEEMRLLDSGQANLRVGSQVTEQRGRPAFLCAGYDKVNKCRTSISFTPPIETGIGFPTAGQNEIDGSRQFRQTQSIPP